MHTDNDTETQKWKKGWGILQVDSSVMILHNTDQKNFPQKEEVTQVQQFSYQKLSLFFQLQIISLC